MKVLITGGFGNIGTAVIDECLKKGHRVSVFDVKNKKTERRARSYSGSLEDIFWGDIRKKDECIIALKEQDAVIHLAAIIPPLSDKKPELCREVNIDGTKNIIEGIKELNSGTAVVFTSSASVMGPTQDRVPPVRVSDPVHPTDIYSRTKIKSEELLITSGLRYCILRLGAVMLTRGSYSFKELDVMFDIPLKARCETIIDLDAATAMAEAAEKIVISGEIDGEIFFIGGGEKNGCRMSASDMIEAMIKPIGLKLPQPNRFSGELNTYYLDWYDTEKAQDLLHFQNHSFDDFRKIIHRKFRLLRPAVKIISPVINRALSSRSPYTAKKAVKPADEKTA